MLIAQLMLGITGLGLETKGSQWNTSHDGVSTQSEKAKK
jgi:hypothetical protein